MREKRNPKIEEMVKFLRNRGWKCEWDERWSGGYRCYSEALAECRSPITAVDVELQRLDTIALMRAAITCRVRRKVYG